ncbi:MAG: FAD-dependent oxidoreductase [Oscillospiraceae bacterium]|nr:FAD-dependent oxidoreductase [Oscillospiraceae bacterium]
MKKYDVIVVGAGPAGLAAASGLANHGARVAVAEANDAPGGQLVKQIHKFFGSAEVCAGVRGIRLADRLYGSAKDAGCDFLFSAPVYSIEEKDGGYAVFAADGEKTRCLWAKAVLLALGASENAVAFPGWTKPGVITAGAAQTMVNQHRVRCGERVLMVGAGNVGLIVSYQLMQAGIEVAAVVEAAPQIGGYEVHADKIRRAGVPVYTSHTVLRAEGEESVSAVTVAQVDETFTPIPGTEKRFEVDTVCLAVGLSPLVKLAAGSGCKMRKNPNKNETIPQYDAHLMTTMPGIFVAGDVAGVEEASIAMEEGAAAACHILAYLGLGSEETFRADLDALARRLEALRSHGEKKEKVYDLAPYENCGAKAVIECFHGIPCDPCAKCCPVGAISVGDEITGTPAIDIEKCTGCGRCVVTCPGQACFLVNMRYSATHAEIAMPYEYFPAPAKGQRVKALNRNGSFVCQGEVTACLRLKDSDNTLLLKLAVPKEFASAVRAIDRREVAAE